MKSMEDKGKSFLAVESSSKSSWLRLLLAFEQVSNYWCIFFYQPRHWHTIKYFHMEKWYSALNGVLAKRKLAGKWTKVRALIMIELSLSLQFNLLWLEDNINNSSSRRDKNKGLWKSRGRTNSDLNFINLLWLYSS